MVLPIFKLIIKLKTHIFLLIVFSFSLSSCTKFGRTHTAKGKVINPITGEGIPNAPMKILKQTLGLSGGMKSVKEIASEADGSFEISKTGLNKYYLQCDLSGDYYEIGWFENGEKIATASSDLALKMGKTKNVDFYAVPYGELKYTINNISCFDVTDTLVIKTTYQIPSTFYNENLNVSIYVGCFQYFGNVYTKLPMGWHFFEGFYKKNNNTTIFKDSIYITENGYHEWIFEY